MEHILKTFDTDLLRFIVIENLSEPVIRISWINDYARSQMPVGMEVSNKGLSNWIRYRSIPKNRAFVNSFLAKCGLSPNRPMDVISVSKGLSLNDSYWVVEENFQGSFDKYNLYENNFSQVLAWVAFTGYGSKGRSTFASSPEFTTNGMLPKCWRRISGKVYLFKGGSSGASNTGNEPYSELYASMIAEAMGINAVRYSVKRWKKNLCSVCELFTSKDVSFVPIGRIVKTGGMKAVREYYRTLGPEFERSLNEMLAFDAIVCNTDRHFGNFGVLIDSHRNKIIAPAPLFDHGNALFNLAGEENWRSSKLLDDYAETLLPAVYDDFFTEARKYMDGDTRAAVRKLLSYELGKSGRYNYPSEKLKLINEQIRKRAHKLLSN